MKLEEIDEISEIDPTICILVGESDTEPEYDAKQIPIKELANNG